MTLGIMQPYFLPYIGYFQLMDKCTKWVIFDCDQYKDKGWVNRNRILHPNFNKEWQFISIPISNKKQFSKIDELIIFNEYDWKSEILGKFSFYKKKAKFYNEALEILKKILNYNSENLALFIENSIKIISSYLEINCKILNQREIFESLINKNNFKAGDWALEITKLLNEDKYINPIDGVKLFDINKFNKFNIKLYKFESSLSNYNQLNDTFVNKLSILDYIAWNGRVRTVEEIKKGKVTHVY